MTVVAHLMWLFLKAKLLLVAGARTDILIVNRMPIAYFAAVKGSVEMITALAGSGRVDPTFQGGMDCDLITWMIRYNRPEGIILYLAVPGISQAAIIQFLVHICATRRDFGLKCLRHAIPFLSRPAYDELLAQMVDDAEASQLLLESRLGNKKRRRERR